MAISFSHQLLSWYEKYGRHDLPWQINPTAYRVWISEIMLQQTQVTTVIPYFERFMQRFPTIKSVAIAKEDDVLSHWSGLGYYARARNIHKTAKIIHKHHHGRFPKTINALSELPGIGRSTAGAIIGFSEKIKAVILDGNVKRVLSRYFAIDDAITQTSTLQKMWKIADKLTPQKNAHHYNQAIMDLGATVCTRSKPRCTDCPFTSSCQAHQKNKATFYPIKTSKKSRPIKKARFLIIENNKREILLLKRPSKGIWGGLWSFPECDIALHYNDLKIDDLSLKLQYIDELEKITHQFTHFILEIFPMCLRVKNAPKLASEKMIWYKLSTPPPGGVAAPVTKIMKLL